MLPGSLAWQAPITVGSSAALQAECHKLEGRAVPEVKKKEKSTAVMHVGSMTSFAESLWDGA